MVVGLALGVVELEARVADLERMTLDVGLVGVAVLGRPAQPRNLELALIDHAVVAGRHDIAVEAVGQGLVGHDARGLPPFAAGLLVESGNPEDVVDVPVRVHGGVQPCGRPPANLVVDVPGGELAAGVDEHEPLTGRERAHVGERGQKGDAVVDRLEAARQPDRMVLRDRRLAPPELVGQREDVGVSHRSQPSASAIGCPKTFLHPYCEKN